MKKIFTKILAMFMCFHLALSMEIKAGPGDTTVVQTFTFDEQNNPDQAYDSPGRRWFEFPSDEVKYQKILMYYTLKCFEDGTAGNLGFPCGEWDYLTYNWLFQHTGVMDSNYVWAPHFKFNNLDFQSIDVLSTPYYHTHEIVQEKTVVDDVQNEVSAELGITSVEINGPFMSGSVSQRTQYLWRADELSAAGLSMGEIQKMALDFVESSDQIRNVIIRLKNTTIDELVSMDNNSLETVFELDISPAIGWNEFVFNVPFEWDGVSNVLVEIGFTADGEYGYSLMNGETTSFSSMASIDGTDRFIHFDWNDEVKVPEEVFENIDNEITISFWLNGDAEWQPQDGTCFEGANAANQRLLNVHLPWSNSNVYWDAGWDGGYDRIEKPASASNYEGAWNHWAFTKNITTGSMKIYLNGALWHSGTNKDNSMADVVKFSLGGAVTWSNFYRGAVDEFAIFNTELDEATIADWKDKDLNNTHPFWSSLQAYYQFNDFSETAMDVSGNDRHGFMHGNASRKSYTSDELFRNVELSNERPVARFYQGEYTTHNEEQTTLWMEQVPAASLAEYVIENYQPLALEPTYFYPEGYAYTFNESGEAIDSLWYEGTQTIVNDTIWYYQAPFEIVNRFELGRYITPYGIQLDLDDDGWTWIYDVTDFEPLLHDSVELEAGNWQELLDMKFVFIEGEPAREVTRVENVWVGNYWLGDMDQYVTERSFELEENEESLKLKTVVTGHGFGTGNNCAEFCNNIHSLDVNGNTEFEWNIIHDCITNPLYPQGGTWMYARAGWCPGKEGKLQEFELTPFLNNGVVSADYNIEEDPNGNYVTESQMIYYGPNLHAHDPEIDRILAPSDWKIHSRWNPMCDNPSFVLRNKGSENLTDLNIIYGVVGGETQTFHWTGDLGFMESEEVSLTYTDALLWQGDDEEVMTFFIELGMSADGADENEFNNYAESSFLRPPLYHYNDNQDNRLIVVVQTNAAYWETDVTLYNMEGNIVFHRDNYDIADETFRDTLELNAGCYMFNLHDTDDDGLSFFLSPDGNGACKLDRVQGIDFINFERDFGRDINHYFYWDTDLVNVDELNSETASFVIMPNPAEDVVYLDLKGFHQDILIEICDITGKLVFDRYEKFATVRTSAINLESLAPGVYNVKVTDGEHQATEKLVVR